MTDTSLATTSRPTPLDITRAPSLDTARAPSLDTARAPSLDTNAGLETRELRKFGLLLGALFLFFGSIAPYVLHRREHLWPLPLAALLFILALARPGALAGLRKFWDALGHRLGLINSRVLLGALYFLIFVPIAMIFSVRGADKLGRRFAPGQDSYRIDRKAAHAAADVETQRKQMERIF